MMGPCESEIMMEGCVPVASAANELSAQHLNSWLVLAVAICSSETLHLLD